jgi:hypothetical protein
VTFNYLQKLVQSQNNPEQKGLLDRLTNIAATTAITTAPLSVKEDVTAIVYDLAKSNLAYCYKQCLDGIEEAWIFLMEQTLSKQETNF